MARNGIFAALFSLALVAGVHARKPALAAVATSEVPAEGDCQTEGNVSGPSTELASITRSLTFVQTMWTTGRWDTSKGKGYGKGEGKAQG